MATALLDSLHYAAKYGYTLLFLWMAAEQFGAPLPAVPLLIACGVLASTHVLGFTTALITAVVACLIADFTWYGIGGNRSVRALQLLCRIAIEPESCVRRTTDFFSRYGARSLVFAKFIPGVSAVAVPLSAGAGLPFATFALYDLLGCTLYVAAYLTLGLMLGDRLDRLEVFERFMATLAVAFVIIATLAILLWRVYQRRKFLGEVRTARISPDDVLQLIHTGRQPYIVDLRHPLDFLPDPRVLPGAIRMTPDEVTARFREIPSDREIILYCT